MISIEPEYSRSKIEKAGKMIAKHNESDQEFIDYIPVVDNWRASHTFPLNKVATIINGVIKKEDGVNFVQRLKRLESIINKLKRENNTGLFRMQDLAGCRIIVKSIAQVYKYVELIKNAIIESGQKIAREYDYIKSPRINSGYRSYHIVVEVVSDENPEYNGMFVEIQIRTVLENLWATTIETIDLMMSETLKAGTGDIAYIEFFKLVSGLFSIEEGTKIVEGIPINKEEIVNRIYEIDKQESIREKLFAYNNVLNLFNTAKEKQEDAYFLLHIDLRKKAVTVKPYTNNLINLAIEDYHSYERSNRINGTDVLLVSGENLDIIKDSYPNYFTDTLKFLKSVSKLCIDYPEKPSVSLAMDNNSKKITDLFDIEVKKPMNNITYSEEDGIGISNGNMIYCPSCAATLDDSYLRFSGIVINNYFVKETDQANVETMNCPGIIVLQTGASFYINKSKWSFISAVDSIFIKCKNSTDIEYLKLLISWIKSNTCLWNILCNYHSNTIASKNVYPLLSMPILNNNDNRTIVNNCNLILSKEIEFVSKYGSVDNSDMGSLNIIKDFNDYIRKILAENESIYCKHYGIDNSSRKKMQNDLGLKGYFVY